MDIKQRIGARVTRQFSSSPQRVFGAWLDPKIAGQWLFARGQLMCVEIDPRAGGGFCLAGRRNGESVEYVGEFLEMVEPHRLVFILYADKYSLDFERVTVLFHFARNRVRARLEPTKPRQDWRCRSAATGPRPSTDLLCRSTRAAGTVVPKLRFNAAMNPLSQMLSCVTAAGVQSRSLENSAEAGRAPPSFMNLQAVCKRALCFGGERCRNRRGAERDPGDPNLDGPIPRNRHSLWIDTETQETTQ
jgi:uncharacterized protein YndB with AHSA1/START domain